MDIDRRTHSCEFGPDAEQEVDDGRSEQESRVRGFTDIFAVVRVVKPPISAGLRLYITISLHRALNLAWTHPARRLGLPRGVRRQRARRGLRQRWRLSLCGCGCSRTRQSHQALAMMLDQPGTSPRLPRRRRVRARSLPALSVRPVLVHPRHPRQRQRQSTSDVVTEYTATAAARREDFDATTLYSNKNPKSLKTLSAALASIRYQKER